MLLDYETFVFLVKNRGLAKFFRVIAKKKRGQKYQKSRSRNEKKKEVFGLGPSTATTSY